VIGLINNYFVPVYASNEDYAADGCAPPEEKAEHRRIYLETLKAKRTAGTVHVYIVAPDGHAIDSMHVADASKIEKLTALLEDNIKRLKVSEGKPLVKTAVQSHAPKAKEGEVVLHIVSRYTVKKGDDFEPQVTKLGQSDAVSWNAYPAENWVVLTAEQRAKLWPKKDVDVGTKFTPDPAVVKEFLTHFYPSTENNDVSKNGFDTVELSATIVSSKDGVLRARLDGKLVMKHSFYGKDDGNTVQAKFAGYVERRADGAVTTIRLITEQGTYGRFTFGVAMRSLP
jgi:hypothetical protein